MNILQQPSIEVESTHGAFELEPLLKERNLFTEIEVDNGIDDDLIMN